VDHTTKQYLYGDTEGDVRAQQRAERAADHFAACVLMPKRWIKSQWVASQNLVTLSRRLGVSSRSLPAVHAADDGDGCMSGSDHEVEQLADQGPARALIYLRVSTKEQPVLAA
jgi:hypothetical protein